MSSIQSERQGSDGAPKNRGHPSTPNATPGRGALSPSKQDGRHSPNPKEEREKREAKNERDALKKATKEGRPRRQERSTYTPQEQRMTYSGSKPRRYSRCRLNGKNKMISNFSATRIHDRRESKLKSEQFVAPLNLSIISMK